MRVLIQRVSSASVHVDGASLSAIERGLLVFLGVETGDTEEDVAYNAAKTAMLRIFPDEAGRMNRSVEDVGGAVLVVSQFTLASSTRRGNRPSFAAAAAPDVARGLYESFVEALRARGLPVATGSFRAMMEVALVNEGPVTILLDPREEARP